MCYSPYGPPNVPLDRYQGGLGCHYFVRWMVEGPWTYIMDDFGNAVPINAQSVR